MGKAALIAVLAIGVMGTVYSLSSSQARIATDSRVAEYQHEVLARAAALAGLELAKQALADNFLAPPSGLKGHYRGIPYQVKIATIGDVATVESTGTATAAGGTTIPFNIRAQYQLNGTVADGVGDEPPLFMQYAMISEHELELAGNVDVKIGAMGNEENKLNANVHSNTRLRAQGSVFVEGFGTSHGPVQRIGQAKFEPFNETNAPAVQGYTERVDMPNVDAAAHVAATAGPQCLVQPSPCPNVHYFNNGLSITQQSQVSGLSGTRDSPAIWVVSGGKLEITGSVTIPGYLLIVAEDGFRIASSVRAGESGYDGDESSIALYSPQGGEIDVKGNAEFHAQIFVEGTMALNGNVDFYGTLATKQTIDIGGTVDIYYRPASPALTRAWQDWNSFIELISYNEW